ncbi:hypothetical protein C8J56DRAFT_890225 [Mycena floridula]|nr:hypothetical protein C8J56DRAFT_890225 [Mycena floridula]
MPPESRKWDTSVSGSEKKAANQAFQLPPSKKTMIAEMLNIRQPAISMSSQSPPLPSFFSHQPPSTGSDREILDSFFTLPVPPASTFFFPSDAEDSLTESSEDDGWDSADLADSNSEPGRESSDSDSDSESAANRGTVSGDETPFPQVAFDDECEPSCGFVY